MNRRRISSGWLVLLALGGLLAGHVASYFVVAPEGHERAELLALTGHAEHSAFGTLALAATFAAVIGLVSSCVARRREPQASIGSRAGVAAFLWALQTAGFVALEAWERGHGFGHVTELLHEPAFLIGLVAQLVVALAATALVLLVSATVAALLRLFVAPLRRGEPRVFPPILSDRPHTSLARTAWNLRGPPVPALSKN